MTFEVLATGAYLEGLALDGDAIWVSDAAAGGIRQFRTDGSVREFLPGRQWIGSLLPNGDGRILVSGEGGILWIDGNSGESGTLLDTIDGQPVAGVNEMVPDGKGGIIFGGLDLASVMRGEKPRPVSIYRMDADRQVTTLVGGLGFTNGVAVSPDGARLYHNATFSGTYSYPIARDGSLGEATLLVEKRDVDGLALDVDGNLWIAGCRSDHILILSPDGTERDRFPLRPGGCSSLRFAGTDRRDLYVTNVSLESVNTLAGGNMPAPDSTQLCRTRAPVAGLKVAPPMFGFR